MAHFSPERVEALLSAMDEAVKNPLPFRGELFTGVDLGTAYIVLAVVDSQGKPVAGSYRFAQVVKDGVLVDFTGAVRILREMKAGLEKKLGVELRLAAAAFPPGTGKAVERTHFYAAQGAGFEVIRMIDEPTAANKVLQMENGVIVDVGGGTTGIAIVKNSEVVYTADEPTGGTHFSLVLAGALKMSFEEAEEFKKDPRNSKDVLLIVKPVIQKVASIINRHLDGYDVDCVYLVGGTACLEGIERVISQELNIPVWKPKNPLFVTPLGIALSCLGGD